MVLDPTRCPDWSEGWNLDHVCLGRRFNFWVKLSGGHSDYVQPSPILASRVLREPKRGTGICRNPNISCSDSRNKKSWVTGVKYRARAQHGKQNATSSASLRWGQKTTYLPETVTGPESGCLRGGGRQRLCGDAVLCVRAEPTHARGYLNAGKLICEAATMRWAKRLGATQKEITGPMSCRI